MSYRPVLLSLAIVTVGVGIVLLLHALHVVLHLVHLVELVAIGRGGDGPSGIQWNETLRRWAVQQL